LTANPKNLMRNHALGSVRAGATPGTIWRDYCFAVATVMVALAGRLLILPHTTGYAFLTFYPAIALSALFFGVRPGLLALALSALAASYFFMPPGATFKWSFDLMLQLGIFCCSGILFCYLKKLQSAQTEENLRADQERLQAVIDSNVDPLVIVDGDGAITMANRQAELLLGYAPGALQDRHCKIIVPDRLYAQHPMLLALAPDAPAAQQEARAHEAKAMRSDGKEIDVEVNLSAIETSRGRLIVTTLHDVSARNYTEAELRINATAFESNDGIIVTNAEGIVQRINLAFTKITGYTAADLVGKTPTILKSNRHNEDFYRAIRDSVLNTGGWQGEIWGRRKNKEEYPQWLNLSAVKNKDGKVTHFVASHSDITERKQAEAEIKDLAFFDQLTGLPNRTLFTDRMRQAILAGGRSDNYGALLFIDLDDFKALNDTLGHDVGDKLLRQVAKRLIAFVREVDTVARLGGDEFVVILANLSADEQEAAHLAETVAEKILASLRLPYQLGGFSYVNTASIGATLYREKLDSFDGLMKQADLAMYKSKAVGRDTVRFFAPAMEAAIMHRAALEKDLRSGLQDGDFLIYYQPQIEGLGRLTGAEVLVRWQRPQVGLVFPSEFIHIAEETRLILPLGQWVLEAACQQLAIWATRPEMAQLTLAVNVSACQFRQLDFVGLVLATLERTGANPRRLKLELTESLLVDDVSTVIEKMGTLKTKGVCFSLDDFGTGYSSLSYLKRMPLDQLKIDQSFVRDVLVDQNDAAIAKTIVALAKSLGLSVIAEGVETEEQREFLAANGCHDYQGYLFSAPLPIAEFEQFASTLLVRTARKMDVEPGVALESNTFT